jgi:hypothetical protein
MPSEALPERRGLGRAGTIDLIHHAAQCRKKGVSSNGTTQKKVVFSSPDFRISVNQ